MSTILLKASRKRPIHLISSSFVSGTFLALLSHSLQAVKYYACICSSTKQRLFFVGVGFRLKVYRTRLGKLSQGLSYRGCVWVHIQCTKSLIECFKGLYSIWWNCILIVQRLRGCLCLTWWLKTDIILQWLQIPNQIRYFLFYSCSLCKSWCSKQAYKKMEQENGTDKVVISYRTLTV